VSQIGNRLHASGIYILYIVAENKREAVDSNLVHSPAIEPSLLQFVAAEGFLLQPQVLLPTKTKFIESNNTTTKQKTNGLKILTKWLNHHHHDWKQ
jgi:hypothetical protein